MTSAASHHLVISEGQLKFLHEAVPCQTSETMDNIIFLVSCCWETYIITLYFVLWAFS